MTRRRLGIALAAALLLVGLWRTARDHTTSGEDAANHAAAQHTRGVDRDAISAMGKLRSNLRTAGIPDFTPVTNGMVTLTGSVIEVDSAKGVGDVEVVFRSVAGESTGVTNADGSYRIEVAAGTYRAFVRSDSVLSVGIPDRELIPDVPHADDADAPIETLMPIVVAERDMTGIELSVRMAGTVSGDVVDGTGKPVANAVIRAANHRVRPALGTDVAETDALGHFEMRLPVGSYEFEAAHPRFAGLAEYAEAEVVAGDPASVHLTLSAGCMITGRVVAPDGKPTGDGAIERQWGDTLEQFGPVATIGEQGAFRWVGTDAGPVTLRAWPWKSAPSKAQRFECKEGARFDNVVLAVENRTPDLAGVLVDHHGTPVPFAHVDISPLDEGGMAQQERTDAAGKWAVYALPSGRYSLGAHAPNRGAAEATVSTGSLAVKLQLGGTGRIVGTTTTLVDGAFELDLYGCGNAGATWHEFDQERRLVRVAQGKFTVEDVPACHLGMITKWRADTNRLELDVPADGVATIEVVAGPAVAKTVAGIVRDESGKPVADVEVMAIDSSEAEKSTTTDANGRYSIVTESGADLGAFGAQGAGRGSVSYSKAPTETVDITMHAHDATAHGYDEGDERFPDDEPMDESSPPDELPDPNRG